MSLSFKPIPFDRFSWQACFAERQSYILGRSGGTRRVHLLGGFGVARNSGYIAGLGFGAVVAIIPLANLQYRVGFLVPAMLALGAAIAAPRLLCDPSPVRNIRPLYKRETIERSCVNVREPLALIGLRSFTYLGLVALLPYIFQERLGFSIGQ